MRRVNALTVRNRLGEVLDALERDGEPVLVSKGRQVRAVLVSPRDFEVRFLDRLAEDARRQAIERIAGLSAKRIGDMDSLAVLRELRGYG